MYPLSFQIEDDHTYKGLCAYESSPDFTFPNNAIAGIVTMSCGEGENAED